jgi:DNA-binding HxlR family transcriptional regulator
MKRGYKQLCGLAKALDVVGERWTLLLVRQFLLGPMRYGQLLADLPGLTTNLLAQRLKELESVGLIEKVTVAGAAAYQLTALGKKLEPVVMELARFGGRYLVKPDKADRANPAWGLLSLKRRYAGGLSASLEVRVNGQPYELAFSPRKLEVQQRAAAAPEATLSVSPESFRALFFGGMPVDALVKAGKAEVSGDPAALARVLGAIVPFQPGVT